MEILKKEDFENLLQVTKAHGGLISSKASEGSKAPYELNISYFDAINDPNMPFDSLAIKRFMASQAVMLALKGIPGIYIHSLLGSRNYHEGVKETGVKRMINREKLSEERIDADLSNIYSRPHQVFKGFLHFLKARERIPAFHPSSVRRVVGCDKRLLVIERRYGNDIVRAVINVSGDKVPLPQYEGKTNAISRKVFHGEVEPYGVYFLR
jgi:glycosidase